MSLKLDSYPGFRSLRICADLQVFSRSLQICADVQDFCRSLQICADSKKNDLIRNTLKTKQRCQRIIKVFKTREKSHSCQSDETFFFLLFKLLLLYLKLLKLLQQTMFPKYYNNNTLSTHLPTQKVATCQISSVKTKSMRQTSFSKFKNHIWKVQVKWINYGV